MLTVPRVTQYQFADTAHIYLQQNEKSYWTRIYSTSPVWEMDTELYSCPTQAMMAAELIILKSRLKCDRFPSCVLSLRKDKQIIQAVNNQDEDLFGDSVGMLATDFLLDREPFFNFIEDVQESGKALHTSEIMRLDGEVLEVETEGTLFKSPVSLFPWLYLRSLNARSLVSKSFESKVLSMKRLLELG